MIDRLVRIHPAARRSGRLSECFGGSLPPPPPPFAVFLQVGSVRERRVELPDPAYRRILFHCSPSPATTPAEIRSSLPVNVDPSQPPSDQLLGFLGRQPHPTAI